MPTYTFRCSGCEYEFSDIFPMAAAEGAGVTCPHCGGSELSRVYKSGPAIIDDSKNSGSCPACPSCSDGTCGF